MAIAAFLFKMRRWLACLLTLLVLLREHGPFFCRPHLLASHIFLYLLRHLGLLARGA